MLRATTACTFSTSQLPKVVRTWCVLYILTWKCASRHNGVQLFISHLASWLRTRRFSEPTFRPSGAPNHWKNTVFRDFPYLFAHLHLLSSDLFSSDSFHLCFSTVHIVGSFTSKLPSISAVGCQLTSPKYLTLTPTLLFIARIVANKQHQDTSWLSPTLLFIARIVANKCCRLPTYSPKILDVDPNPAVHSPHCCR